MLFINEIISDGSSNQNKPNSTGGTPNNSLNNNLNNDPTFDLGSIYEDNEWNDFINENSKYGYKTEDEQLEIAKRDSLKEQENLRKEQENLQKALEASENGINFINENSKYDTEDEQLEIAKRDSLKEQENLRKALEASENEINLSAIKHEANNEDVKKQPWEKTAKEIENEIVNNLVKASEREDEKAKERENKLQMELNCLKLKFQELNRYATEKETKHQNVLETIKQQAKKENIELQIILEAGKQQAKTEKIEVQVALDASKLEVRQLKERINKMNSLAKNWKQSIITQCKSYAVKKDTELDALKQKYKELKAVKKPLPSPPVKQKPLPSLPVKQKPFRKPVPIPLIFSKQHIKLTNSGTDIMVKN